MQLNGIYAGFVENNRDPEKLGRLKVRAPTVFGSPGGGNDSISVNDLPWAIPMGLPAGGSPASGGVSFLPEINDQVFVQFLDGEPEKPVWCWGMQSRPQAADLPIHKYEADTRQLFGKPSRAVVTRYGHSMELSAKSLIFVTNKGNAFLLDDAVDGALISLNKDLQINARDVWADVAGLDLEAQESIRLKTQADLTVLAKDLATNVEDDSIHTVGSSFTLLVAGSNGSSTVYIKNGAITLIDASGQTFTLDGQGHGAWGSPDGTNISLENGKVSLATPDLTSVVIENGKVSVTAKELALNTQAMSVGSDALDHPVLARQLLLWLNTHTHGNGNNGSPTTTPIAPLVEAEVASKIITTN